jgi:hypothetical protein
MRLFLVPLVILLTQSNFANVSQVYRHLFWKIPQKNTKHKTVKTLKNEFHKKAARIL